MLSQSQCKCHYTEYGISFFKIFPEKNLQNFSLAIMTMPGMEAIATNNSIVEATVQPFETYFDGIDINDIFMDPLYKKIMEEFKRSNYKHKEPRTVILVTLYIPIFLMAFFGNIMVLFVVLPNRHMRNVTNFFLVNLAVADLTGRQFFSRDYISVLIGHYPIRCF